MTRLSLQVIETQHPAVHTSQLTVAGRRSAILTYESAHGLVRAEASPLDGFGEDSWAQAYAELKGLSAQDLDESCIGVAAAFDASRSGLLDAPSDPAQVLVSLSTQFRSPSARFAVECLVLGAAAEAHGVHLGRLLAADRRATSFPTSAVVDPSSADWRQALERNIEAGIRTFKIKCGLDESRELHAARVLGAHRESLRFRLDPNRAWTPSDVLAFVAQIDQEKLDWVEDPTNDLSEWEDLGHQVPLAMDEFLPVVEPESAWLPQVLILKPMALGGISECVKWASFARQTGRRICPSHFFDGPIAMKAYIHVAFSLASPDLTPGLGRHRALDSYADLSFSLPELGPASISTPNEADTGA